MLTGNPQLRLLIRQEGRIVSAAAQSSSPHALLTTTVAHG
jgi:hypothetical protein